MYILGLSLYLYYKMLQSSTFVWNYIIFSEADLGTFKWYDQGHFLVRFVCLPGQSCMVSFLLRTEGTLGHFGQDRVAMAALAAPLISPCVFVQEQYTGVVFFLENIQLYLRIASVPIGYEQSI